MKNDTKAKFILTTRGESCAFWDMARRFGVRCCATCKRYGPDADEVCICHVYQHIKKPGGYCDEWEKSV